MYNFLQVITSNIKRIAEFLNSFDMSCRSKLSQLNEKLTMLERRIEYLEARVTKGETLNWLKTFVLLGQMYKHKDGKIIPLHISTTVHYNIGNTHSICLSIRDTLLCKYLKLIVIIYYEIIASYQTTLDLVYEFGLQDSKNESYINQGLFSAVFTPAEVWMPICNFKCQNNKIIICGNKKV